MRRPGDAPAEPTIEPEVRPDLPELSEDEPDLDGDSDVDAEVPRQRSEPPVDETGLTERERAILTFERKWWKHAGAKEQAIRDAFDLSATRYYQLLNALLDNPAAVAYEPVVVGRLRRLRSTRSRSRRR